MKNKLLLRIAAVLLFLHAIGHSFGAFNWKKAPNEAVGKVILGMQTVSFEFMGRTTFLASFYEGYGMIMIFVLLFVAVLLWQLSSVSQKALIAPVAVFLLLLAITEYIYFFPFAAAFSFLAGVCSGLTLFRNQV
jgi:hypothetical protein